MTALKFFNEQSTTDTSRAIVDKYKHKFSKDELIVFAQAYGEYMYRLGFCKGHDIAELEQEENQ